MKKKFIRILNLLLAAAIVFSTMCALPMTSSAAESGKCGDNLTWTLDDSGTLTISGTGAMERCLSPDERPWYVHRNEIATVKINEGATGIGCYAFYGCTALKSITIPDGVTSIEWSAFEDCTALADITLPDSITSIGHCAFDNTEYYENPDNWTENVLYIGNHLIKAETSLSGEYSVREGTKTIAGNAFKNCAALTGVTIPEGAAGVGYFAFDGCKSLAYITLPDSITSIGHHAFEGSVYYNNPASWTENVLYIGNHLIKAEESLSGEYSVRKGTKTIAGSAFSDCKSLTGITIPDGVISIEHNVFFGCSSLKDIKLPDSLIFIGECAFQDCTALTALTVPNGVTRIKMTTFYGCTSLKEITLPDGITSIDYLAFDGCTSLTDITLPDSLNNIEQGAFYGCTALTDIIIPDKVTSIGYEAFRNCSALKNVTLPDGLKNIGEHAFQKCTALISIIIPDGVPSIGEGTFRSCSALKGIFIPESVTSIEETAFWECNMCTIYGSSGSCAQKYANENYKTFVDVRCDDNIHLYSDWVIDRAASCTETGLKHRECELCHEVESADIAALGHDYDTEWTVDIPATETTPGSKSHHCKVCGDKTDITEIPTVMPPKESVTKQFKDVVPDEWYVSAVQYAVDNKLFFGVSDTEFAPDAAMNRAMLVTVLWRLEGRPTANAENKFTDVPANEWYTQAVIWASENGIVYGTGETEYSPEENITREQMAAILYRYAQKKGYDVTASTDLNAFPDGSDTSEYALDALSWACGSGLIFGSDGKLLPQDGATRAQVAAILMRYTQKVVQ